MARKSKLFLKRSASAKKAAETRKLNLITGVRRVSGKRERGEQKREKQFAKLATRLRRIESTTRGWKTRRKNRLAQERLERKLFFKRSRASKKGWAVRREKEKQEVKQKTQIPEADRRRVRAAFDAYLHGNEDLRAQFGKLTGQELRDYAGTQMARIRSGTGFKPGDYLVVMRYLGGASDTTPKGFGLEFAVNARTGLVRRLYTPADTQRELARAHLHRWGGPRATVVPKAGGGFEIQ